MIWLRSLLLLLLCSALAQAEDWPHWLGPFRDGSTPEKVVPWKKAPQVLWRQPVGEGFSAPVIAEGRVFHHAGIKDKDEEEVIALDARSGKKLWRATYARARFKSLIGTGPRATPAVMLNRVYTYGITGVLSCFEVDSGKLVWRVDAYKKFKAAVPKYGVCCSPLIEGNRVLVSVGGKGTAFVAFDSDSGDVLWKGLDEPASTTSPIVITYSPAEQETRREVVFLSGKGLVSFSPLNGEFAWDFPLSDRKVDSAPTPVCVGNLILTNSVKNGGTAVRLARKKGHLTASALWKNPDLTSSFSPPVLVGKDHVCMVINKTSPEVTVLLECIDAKTGKALWTKPKIGDHHVGLLRTGNNKLLLLTDRGILKLVDPNPKAYRELATAKVSGPTFINPALANGRLYIRDGKEVVCLDMGGPSSRKKK
jgi:outer membrane protein assembly factor BamB